MRAQLTIKNGERWSTDQLLYQRSTKKLKILTNALVTRVIFFFYFKITCIAI